MTSHLVYRETVAGVKIVQKGVLTVLYKLARGISHPPTIQHDVIQPVMDHNSRQHCMETNEVFK